ncbi:hypothetical protein ANACAC_00624 [Anaerostipes caccae L1-92]|uniref:Uncharacterized protein n=1 Tax=Anaerostipes caccae (strain DSM 14662 / CCUG 47493 / JCM 13470 / NCIMB 13811 / L1-92) TaxID=411490 RepID=B0MAP9_ANACD|nr:hypothetical protein ANACAC_00624 [Anaerostipes caccae L1-92]
MSLSHYICLVGTEKYSSFETGYRLICDMIQQEKYLFQCAKASSDFDLFTKVAM